MTSHDSLQLNVVIDLHERQHLGTGEPEKQVSPMDGRRNRLTNAEDEVPLNVDVSPEVKQLVLLARANFGISMKTFVAEAIQHYFGVLEARERRPTGV